MCALARIDHRRTIGAIEFAETAAWLRAVIYRERAAHLTAMAQAESDRSRQKKLAELAALYRELAESLGEGRPGTHEA